MSDRRWPHLVLVLAPLLAPPLDAVQSAGSFAAQTAQTPETAPGIRIEGADPGPAAERRRRLAAWRRLYHDRLGELRSESGKLFEALERSSLAASTWHCERLVQAAAELDREGLFSSSDVRLDRVLFGSLERFEIGALECLAGRYLKAFRLLDEARAGLRWIDRRLVSRLRPPVPLPGLKQ